ncbi:MAG: histidine--tRNA ligase [Chlamydiae bacterium]|nr:histidine--tRNA ligase [Chlamydiota bacterium]
MKYSQPKGTFDILPNQLKAEDSWKLSDKWRFVEKILYQTALDYGFKEIRTPIFESTDLFIRSVGDASDIVSKEMYTFEDKGGRSMSLRPEGTASVIRAFIENHLYQLGADHKLCYTGPYFRYDRPQAGRFRQFHQFGVEAIGRSDPFQDVEIIDLLCEMYRRLDIKNLKVLLNSVGDAPSRERYQNALVAFLTPHIESLSEDSKLRLQKNPLRILDTKNLQEIQLLQEAPSLADYLSDASRKHFDTVCDQLTKLNIAFHIEPRLVRGLDYYNQTVFEVTSNVLGAQNSIGAGGRYDGLIKALGGPDLPSIGFATGIERILHTMLGQKCRFPESPTPFIFLIPLGNAAQNLCFSILCTLRHARVPTEISIKATKMQKALQDASDSQAFYSLILGDQEIEQGVAQLKNMNSREAQNIPLKTLLPHLLSLWEKRPLEKKH